MAGGLNKTDLDLSQYGRTERDILKFVIVQADGTRPVYLKVCTLNKYGPSGLKYGSNFSFQLCAAKADIDIASTHSMSISNIKG